MSALKMRSTGRFRVHRDDSGPDELTPFSTVEIGQILGPDRMPGLPIRPQGAATSSTDCNSTTSGTVIATSGLAQIRNIDTYNHTVTAQAGVRLFEIVEALAEQGLELAGNFELTGRSLGGAIAAPCFGPGIGTRGGFLSSHVESLKVVTPAGKLLSVSSAQKDLMRAMRMSYGMLGVIVEATLKVQPITTFSATHRKLTVETFCSVVDRLSNGDVGFKFYLMPYRDRVYLDLRRYAESPGSTYSAPWKFKDWGETTVLPSVYKGLNRLLPIHSVRYPLIDRVSEATHGLVNGRFVTAGNNATTGLTGKDVSKTSKVLYSTWCFPAADFSVVARAYQNFCQQTYEESRYRCDMPAIGFGVCHDDSALLSPSFDEPMIALQTASTQSRGWEDFVIDLSDFAVQWGGVPLFNQSRNVGPDHAQQVYANRLELFRRIRRQLDPEDRLLNPLLSQYFR